MAKKLNFIEKGVFVLTYKKFLMIIALWVAVCFGVFMIELAYNWYLGASTGKNKKVLQELNVRKERTLALVEASKVRPKMAGAKELSQVYDNYPLWSGVMAAISGSMPPQLWLTSVKTEYLAEDSMIRKIEIGGMARNTSSIASFMKQLNSRPQFLNMILNKSERVMEEDRKKGYSFVILGEVKFGEKVWN